MTAEQAYLTIDVTSTPDAHTIVLTGEADLLGTPKIEAAIKDAYTGHAKLIVIDLSNLTFIDSSGLQALVVGYQQCQVTGQELRIIPGPANVQRLFEITGMNETLPFSAPDLTNTAERRAGAHRPDL